MISRWFEELEVWAGSTIRDVPGTWDDVFREHGKKLRSREEVVIVQINF